MTKRGAILAVCFLATAAAAALLVHGELRAASSRARHARHGVGLRRAISGVPTPRNPAFLVGRPTLLRRGESLARYAAVLRPVTARRWPSAAAPPVTDLEPQTSDGTANIVLVVGSRDGAGGWVRVRLPVLPNGSTGWVPRAALGGYGTVLTHLIVDRARLTATLVRAGRRVLEAPIGIGRRESPTPAGEFFVRNRVTRYRSPFYGPVAFGTSARSATLTEWPGGGFIGIHGTDRPALLPGRVSHGCIRMRNADIVRLARLMPIGTPVVVR
jgi:hypothetical protein